MRYSICYKLNGKVEKYLKQKIKELAKEFNEPYLLNNPIPAHVTLKYPFEGKNIHEIENLLKNFVKKNKKTKIKVRKINNFHNKVVFLQFDFSKKAKTVFRNLIKTLHKIKWLEWNSFDDIEGKFH